MSGAGIYVKTPSGLVAAATVPGPSGSQGPQSSLVPGTITTGAAGSSAAATITGAGPVQTLNLTIPKGDPGGWVASAAIATGTDLNTIIVPGIYFNGTANATMAGTNPPLQVAGTLEVLASSGGWVVQRYSVIEDASTNAPILTYERRRNSSAVWRPWRAFHLQGAIGVGDLTGTGSPEGAIIAPVGTYYTDTAITNGAMRWAKKTGTGNTGWKVIEGDTGRRNITSLFAGWSGEAYLQRIDDTVFLSGVITKTASDHPGTVADVFAAGFRPRSSWRSLNYYFNHSVGSGIAVHIATGNSGSLTIERQSGPAWAAGQQTSEYFSSTSFLTIDAWPTTLPGVAA